MGAIILAALHIMRIVQVRPRRTAWLLALVGALAMPMLVAAQIGPPLLPQIAAEKAPEALESAPWIPKLHPVETYAPRPAGNIAADRARITSGQGGGFSLLDTLAAAAVAGYGVIAAVLVLRLCFGVGFAFRLRNVASRLPAGRVAAERIVAQFDPALDVRSTARIATPVTVGLSVLLPESFVAWDETTLRIVLSHERAHVRQGDFYIHALAELHCALFWFNPFSWWLRRELSALGEALSDRAAVEQADSRACYAELLLAFASRGQLPLAGVAMACASNLTSRIERLLSEKNFERSFTGKPRLPSAAAVVILAMLAATATLKVHAVTNVANLPAPVALDALNSSAVPAAPQPPAAVPAAPSVPAALDAPKKPHAPKAPVAPQPLEPEGSPQQGVLGLRMGHSRISINLAKNWPLAGDYIYFQHDGKPFLIQDPSVIAEAQKSLAPMQELAEKQNELGAERALLGAKQRLSSTRRVAMIDSAEMKIDTTKFKRDMVELQNLIRQMDFGELNVKIDPRAVAKVASQIADIQAATLRLQSQLGQPVSNSGEQQGELGERQGKLEEEQRALQEQRRQIIEGIRRQLQPMIEQAIREGKVTQLAE